MGKYLSNVISRREMNEWPVGGNILIGCPLGAGRTYFLNNSLSRWCKASKKKLCLISSRYQVTSVNTITWDDIYMLISTKEGEDAKKALRVRLREYDVLMIDECLPAFRLAESDHHMEAALDMMTGSAVRLTLWCTGCPDAIASYDFISFAKRYDCNDTKAPIGKLTFVYNRDIIADLTIGSTQIRKSLRIQPQMPFLPGWQRCAQMVLLSNNFDDVAGTFSVWKKKLLRRPVTVHEPQSLSWLEICDQELKTIVSCSFDPYDALLAARVKCPTAPDDVVTMVVFPPTHTDISRCLSRMGNRYFSAHIRALQPLFDATEQGNYEEFVRKIMGVPLLNCDMSGKSCPKPVKEAVAEAVREIVRGSDEECWRPIKANGVALADVLNRPLYGADKEVLRALIWQMQTDVPPLADVAPNITVLRYILDEADSPYWIQTIKNGGWMLRMDEPIA